MTVFRHTVNVDTGASSANLRELEQNSDRLERSLRSAEDRAGRFGTASTKLAGILGRVSPALGESAMMANDLADGFEVATMGGARVLAVLGPVAAAAGVAAGAYFVLKGRLDEANEAMKVSAERATEMQRINEQVAVTTRLAKLANEEMTQAEFNRLAAAETAEDLFAAQIQNGKGRVSVLNEEREAIEKQIAATKERIALDAARVGTGSSEEQALDNLVSAFGLDPQERLDQLNQDLASNVRVTNNALRELGNLDRAQTNHAENLETVANSTGTATAAVHTYTVALDDAADAVERLGFTTQEGLTSEEALFQNAEFVMQRLRGEISDDQFNELINPGGADRDAQAAAAAEAALKASQRQGDMSGIADGLGMLSNPASALAMAGPVGAIVAGLSAVGTLGADGVEAQMENLVMTISAGIKALPEILIDVLPEIGRVIVTELPAAIFEALRSLFQELFDKITGIFGGGDGGILSDDGGLSFLEGTGVGNFGDDIRSVIRGTSSSRGRVARADGATRAAMSRAPTAAMMAQPSVTINALGIDDGTQDQFQRTFARYTDSNTGLRGRG